jgi:adenine phosphoribosyltransferase
MSLQVMPLDKAIQRLVNVYRFATTVKTGRNFTTVNELTDQIPATNPETLRAALDALQSFGPIVGDKILTEEDKGALLAGLMSLETLKPVAMARWYSYHIPSAHSIVVPIDMEYARGQLLVNGIRPGDNFTIIDDTLSTGGTAISLIRAARALGAHVVEMRVITEKLGFGGREHLMDNTGLDVKAVLGISINEAGAITVEEVFGRPCKELAWLESE